MRGDVFTGVRVGLLVVIVVCGGTVAGTTAGVATDPGAAVDRNAIASGDGVTSASTTDRSVTVDGPATMGDSAASTRSTTTQAENGTITGTVVDSDGAAAPGARVVAVDTSVNAHRLLADPGWWTPFSFVTLAGLKGLTERPQAPGVYTTTTAGDGSFTLSLPPGTYTLRAYRPRSNETQAFVSGEQPTVSVSPDQRRELSFSGEFPAEFVILLAWPKYEVDVGNASGRHDATVRVPIRAGPSDEFADPANITGGRVTLTFNPDVAQVTGIESADASISDRTIDNDAGRVSFTARRDDAVANATLGTVTFRLTANATTATHLVLDAPTRLATTNGTVYAPPVGDSPENSFEPDRGKLTVRGASGRPDDPDEPDEPDGSNATVSRIAFDYDDFGGEVNLEVNGDRRVTEDLADLDGATVGGASVAVTPPDATASGEGTVVLSGTIESFSVGGQEFRLDDVRFGPAGAPRADVEFTTLSPARSTYPVGETFTSSPSNVSLSVEPFRFMDGELYRQGSGSPVGGDDPGFGPTNVNLRVDLDSLPNTSRAVPPQINASTFTIEPYPVEVGERPHVSVNVTDAENVSVKATFDGQTVTREMERRNGATWRTVQPLPGISDPGTRVELVIIARNGNETDTLTTFNNSYLEFNDTLRYYVFRERQDVLVVLGTFADEDPFGNATRLENETDLRAWQRAREFDINHYYGSANGSMGARGFDFIYKDNHGDFYRVSNSRDQYLGDAVAYLEDLKAVADSDVTFTDYDDWIGTHPGNTTVRRAFVINSKRMYVSMTHFNDTGSHAGVWTHELGHIFGLDDLYNKGNVSRRQALMADGSISYHPEAIAPDTDKPTHGHIFRQNPPPINAVTRLGRNGGDVNWLEENTTKVSDLTDDPRVVRVDALHSYSLGDRVPVVDGGTLGSSTDYILEGRFDLKSGAVVVYRHYSNPLDTTIDSLPPLQTPGQTLEDKIGLADPVFVTLTLVNETGDRTQYQAAVRANATAKPNVVVGALQPVIIDGLDALSRPNVTAPDLDLVAVDNQGRMVGRTPNGEYVNEIPGADASGDRRGVEWIAVPEDVDVQFRVVSTDAQQFINETGRREGSLSIQFRTSTTHYGDEPRITEQNGTVTVTNTTVVVSSNRSIEPGETTTAVREPVVAAFTSVPGRPQPNQTVTFDASLSFGLNTTITEYEWAFGDGTTATGEQVTHTYTESGTYTVSLTVTDATGQTSTTRQTVTVRSEPRVPDVTGDGTPARDPDDDGLYEDVNGDGEVTPGDATVLFDAVFDRNTAVTDNVALFDFNGDGGVTPGDATVLFEEAFAA